MESQDSQVLKLHNAQHDSFSFIDRWCAPCAKAPSMLSEMGPTTVSFARFLVGFFCRKHLNNFYLQTQSQELGAETVVDTDMLYGMGIVSFQYMLSRNLRNWSVREGRTRALRSEIRNGRRATTRLRSAGQIQPGMCSLI